MPNPIRFSWNQANIHAESQRILLESSGITKNLAWNHRNQLNLAWNHRNRTESIESCLESLESQESSEESLGILELLKFVA